MAALLAQLPGPINLRLVLSDTKFSDILHDLLTAKGNRSGVPRALAVDRNETRELAGTLHLEAPGVPVYSYTYSYTDNIIPVMTSATAPSGVASASGNYDAPSAEWHAFDHAADSWVAPAGTTGWLQYRFPTAHTVVRYAVTTRDDAATCAPKTWTFKGSNDGTAWVTLDARTNITDWAAVASQREVFDFPNATAYAYYRLDITASNHASYLNVGELEMMETTETTETIVSYSSGKDNAIAQIRAINALVTVGTTLTLQSTGATDAVTLNILPSRGVSQPLDELFEIDGAPVLASCAFSFTCEPYAYGPETTVYENSGAVLPNVIDIDVPGDYPTPLQFSFDEISSGAVHAMYIGMLPDQATPLSSLLRPASSAQYSGTCYVNAGNPAQVSTTSPHGLTSGQTVEFWDTATDPVFDGIPYVCSVIDSTQFTIPRSISGGGYATLTTFTCPDGHVVALEDVNCFSGYQMANDHLDWASWEIDDRSMSPGTYLPLVRMGQDGDGVNNVFLSSAAVTGPGFTSTGADVPYSLDPLSKTLRLPYYRMVEAAAVWATPKLWWIPSGGTPTLYMDYLALMPTTWGWAFYHDTYPSAGAANWMLGYDGAVYKNLRVTPDGRSGGMLAVGAQRVFMVAAERHNAWRASAVTGRLIIKAVPRYALWA